MANVIYPSEEISSKGSGKGKVKNGHSKCV